ncbi:pyridoxamine 5'-phosphate oxidase family protein [Pricia sp. S334]|uniref:Pyridoxamine 5'-phosphate oxidase family protein n=1 Tax=Pricia mediterranea TaxID=3076079 RepID=A0ABU3L112_9FLAO|nr:pyridoxamine 5'-phosphate oxidase family protein [Pricia sp. S334]MDT7827414.1 pyridoxamine 5'-phosphate oxidase family protein [Pricia sp. S334]
MEVYFQKLKEELQTAAEQKEHPFHFFTLGTVGLEHLPRLRTVVLREISDELKLTFYTDKRSKKILHIKENPKVSLLFYHPKKLLQLKIEGLATIIKDPSTLADRWTNIRPASKKDYTTATAPGSDIDNPDALEYLREGDYFCMVDVTPFKIEYLQLKRPNHLRIRFSKKNEKWKGNYLVP